MWCKWCLLSGVHKEQYKWDIVLILMLHYNFTNEYVYTSHINITKWFIYEAWSTVPSASSSFTIWVAVKEHALTQSPTEMKTAANVFLHRCHGVRSEPGCVPIQCPCHSQAEWSMLITRQSSAWKCGCSTHPYLFILMNKLSGHGLIPTGLESPK